MDRVMKSYLESFKKNMGLEKCSESDAFEHFVDYTIIEPKSEYGIDDVESINIGIGGTIGIDGFSVLLNNQIINTEDELNDFIDENKKCEAEVIFIQSKRSSEFNRAEILNFGTSIKDFISEDPKLNWSNKAKEKIKLFNILLSRISELKNTPECSIYYVTLGKRTEDKNIIETKKYIENDIQSENVFNSVNFELFGSANIQHRYKKIGQSIEKEIIFESRVALPEIRGVSEGFIGIIDGLEVINLMTDEKGNLVNNIFYDNVRDFQGDNKVNVEIEDTIRSKKKDSFVVLNNGITIVAEDLKMARNKFTLINYQIVNGCQTSHVLYKNRDAVDKNIKIPIKLIVSTDVDLTSRVIRSTNRQTEIKEQDLIAFTDFQKELEDFYNSFQTDERLYYERRGKQYNRTTIPRKKIIDKTTQIKAVASMYYRKPEMATRYFGTLLSEFGDKLFNEDDSKLPYYVAALGIYKIETMFRDGLIDNKYKKIKYHILTMLTLEINTKKYPAFNSKKINKYCKEIQAVFLDDKDLQKKIDLVTSKIDSLKYDLKDLELSKSKEFVKKCIELYY